MSAEDMSDFVKDAWTANALEEMTLQPAGASLVIAALAGLGWSATLDELAAGLVALGNASGYVRDQLMPVVDSLAAADLVIYEGPDKSRVKVEPGSVPAAELYARIVGQIAQARVDSLRYEQLELLRNALLNNGEARNGS